MIVPLPFALSTPAVYAEADRLELPRDAVDLRARSSEVQAALAAGVRFPESLTVNDLQPAAVSLCPEISEALDAVSAAGADHALVSGSGPTVVGICWGAGAAERAEAASATLAQRFPATTTAGPVTAELGAARGV